MCPFSMQAILQVNKALQNIWMMWFYMSMLFMYMQVEKNIWVFL